MFCYVLYAEKSVKGPLRLFVTDFTSSQHITNTSFPKDIEIDGSFVIYDDKILRIDVFDDKIALIRRLYTEYFGTDFFADMEEGFDSTTRRFYVHEKFWIIKPVLSLKKYNSTTEARLKRVSFVSKQDTHPSLQRLYQRFEELPHRYLHRQRDRINAALPKEFVSKFLDGDSSHFSGQEVQQSLQRQIKRESDSDDIIPDTLFAEDYVNSDSEANASHQIGWGSDHNNKESIYSICALNSMSPNGCDNKIFNIIGYIVASFPEDWSYICSKGYQLNTIKGEYETTDPLLRHLELLITDVFPSIDSSLALSSKNSLLIFLDGPQLSEMLGLLNVESIYTRIHSANEKFHEIRNIPLKMVLYKKKLQISQNKYLTVWTAKNLKLNVI
ncbi:uncharacterized protein PRCAT00001734001 [Priceomyces carsonii]|uniref:uncharacterized protein n=1 Tax=Priceomyces carsonii TaxID=28549 RepID=UPI002ED8F350|nr:unnamed protein product [Priceomyces carsonii]